MLTLKAAMPVMAERVVVPISSIASMKPSRLPLTTSKAALAG
jgi:hypothetical protein